MVSDDSRRTLRELARVIFSRLFGVILVLVVVVAGVVAATFLGPWRYRSEAMLEAGPAEVAVTPLENPTTMRDRLSLFILTQRELIMSQHVLASALMKLDGIEGQTGPGGKWWYTDGRIQEFVNSNVRRMSEARKRVSVRTPGGTDATFTQMLKVFVDWPEERKLKGDSRTLATERAQQFANYLLDAYQFRRTTLEARRRKERALFLTDTASVKAKDNLDKAQEKLQIFTVEKLGDDLLLVRNMLEGIGETGSQKLRTRFQGEINTIDARLAELAALSKQIDKEIAKDASEQVIVPEQLLKANASLIKIIDSIVALRLQLNNLRSQFTEGYKAIGEIKTELTSNMADLKAELVRQRTMLDQESAALEGRREAFVKGVEKDKKTVADLAGKVAEFSRLDKMVDNAQKIYDKAQTQLLNAQAPPVPFQVSVIDPPSRPDPSRPHRPLLWVNVLVGIFAGLVLALVYAFLADHFDHTVKGIDDIERYVDTEVLASIPKFTRRIIRSR